jgi:mono/diheme cytochrome c family protein
VNAHRLGAIGFIASLTLAAAGCSEVDDSIPNQSEASRAIHEKVQVAMELDRLKRLAPRLAASVAAAEASPTAKRLAPQPEAASSVPTEARPAGELYAQNCASCHGPTGAGDGPLSATLVPKPAKHADGVYMNALSNDHLFKVVKEGGAAVGKSAMMAPWGASISDQEIYGLVAYMRTLADPPYTGAMP